MNQLAMALDANMGLRECTSTLPMTKHAYTAAQQVEALDVSIVRTNHIMFISMAKATTSAFGAVRPVLDLVVNIVQIIYTKNRTKESSFFLPPSGFTALYYICKVVKP